MKAIIFDMDGVITDSETHWQKEEYLLLKKLVHGWTRRDQNKLLGRTIEEAYGLLKKHYGLQMSKKSFMAQVDRIATGIYRKKANLMEGFLEFVKKLKGKVPLALCSSSRRRWIELFLARYGLHKYFDAIVSFEDIGRRPGKPAPDIYLYTAKRLGVHPRDCMVIEDSRNGVKAGKSAGMFVIGLLNGSNNHQDIKASDVQATGFKELCKIRFFSLGKLRLGPKLKNDLMWEST